MSLRTFFSRAYWRQLIGVSPQQAAMDRADATGSEVGPAPETSAPAGAATETPSVANLAAHTTDEETPASAASVPDAPAETPPAPAAESPPMATAPEAPSPQGRRRRSAVPLWAAIVLAGLFGAVVGLGAFTVYYASGLSYLSNDPEACVNCHIMRPQFDAWNRGSHHAVATCNDCHAPHDNVFSKYATKALNGLRHSYAFTTGDFPEPIRITSRNEEIARKACLYCHGALTNDINHADAESTDCLRCHSRVGHGT